ncbi:GNAT family N-acetyltransferase, partial [Achromobacter xylosoxidans]|uniref:GNAT family N-acetyltransferase n=1 Tax=Alcaligenes xylosoxydans xylosoxydans TaxID=85698 RepID=UPI001906F0E5
TQSGHRGGGHLRTNFGSFRRDHAFAVEQQSLRAAYGYAGCGLFVIVLVRRRSIALILPTTSKDVGMSSDIQAVCSGSPGASGLLREFLPSDHTTALELWTRTPGVGLSSADNYLSISTFLDQNPGLSFTAWDGDVLVGTILCGHDGRRGLIHHLVVSPSMRRRGLGTQLVSASLDGLAARGIEKCHLLVFADNAEGQAFWRRIGAVARDELVLYSCASRLET